MNAPTLSQHDGRWAAQRLGTENGATIGGYGCLICCITMLNDAFGGGEGWPNNVDDIFTNEGGYVGLNAAGAVIARAPQMGCDVLDWNKIQQLLPNCAHVAVGYYTNAPADLGRIKAAIDAANSGVILEVRWLGNPALQHFVLAVGYSGNDIIVNDPEKGDRVAFSSKRFGSGNSATDILTAHFFADAIPPVQAAPPPPQPAPAAPPLSVSNLPDPVTVTPPQEDEVTQAQSDAAVAAAVAPLNAQLESVTGQLATANSEKAAAQDIASKQADTITKLTAELANFQPEYVASEVVHTGEPTEYITTEDVIVVDFDDRLDPVDVEAGQTLELYSTFTVAGKTYIRSQTAKAAGAWFGYPQASVKVYATGTPEAVLDLSKIGLTAEQQLHAAAAGAVGWWQSVLNKLPGGKK